MSRPHRIGIGLTFLVTGLAIICLQVSSGGLVRQVGFMPLVILAGFGGWALKAAGAAAFRKRGQDD